MSLLAAAFGPEAIAVNAVAFDRTAAICLAGDLLVASGRALPEYTVSMLAAVEEYGPYIVIAPGIALAHGKPNDQVIETGLSLAVLSNPIEFQHSQNDPVRMVFALAALDHDSHLELMSELASFLSAVENIDALLRCEDSDQIRALLG